MRLFIDLNNNIGTVNELFQKKQFQEQLMKMNEEQKLFITSTLGFIERRAVDLRQLKKLGKKDEAIKVAEEMIWCTNQLLVYITCIISIQERKGYGGIQ